MINIEESQTSADVFRGCRSVTLAQNGLRTKVTLKIT